MKIALIVTLFACLSYLATANKNCGYKEEKKDEQTVRVQLECRETEVCCLKKLENNEFLGKCIDHSLFIKCGSSFKLRSQWAREAQSEAKTTKLKKLK